MIPTTIEGWLTLLREQNKGSLQELCKVILNNIDGYGVEYGFDDAESAQDLANAFQALNILLAEASKA